MLQVLAHKKSSKALFARARKLLKRLEREKNELTGKETALYQSLVNFLFQV